MPLTSWWTIALIWRFCVILYALLIFFFWMQQRWSVHQLAGSYRDNDEEYLRKIWVDKLPQLIQQLNEYNLVLHIDTSALPSENATEFLNRMILSHLDTHSITVPPSPTAPVHRIGQSDVQANYFQLAWKLVALGYKKMSAEGLGQNISNASIPYHDMTWHKLFSNAPGTPSKELLRLKNPNKECPLVLIGIKSYHSLCCWCT